MGDGLHPIAREYANQLALHHGWVGQRSEKIEDRSGAKLNSWAADVAHGAVVARRHHKADAGLVHRALDEAHVAVEINTELG